MTKFQLPTPNGLRAVLKNQMGGGGGEFAPRPSEVGLIQINAIHRNFPVCFPTVLIADNLES